MAGDAQRQRKGKGEKMHICTNYIVWYVRFIFWKIFPALFSYKCFYSSFSCPLAFVSSIISYMHTFTRTVFVPLTFFRFHSFPQKHRGLRSRSAAKGLSTSASIPSGSASTRTTTTAKATTTESISKGISMPQILLSRFVACTSMRVPHGQLHTSNSRERSPSCAPVSL